MTTATNSHWEKFVQSTYDVNEIPFNDLIDYLWLNDEQANIYAVLYTSMPEILHNIYSCIRFHEKNMAHENKVGEIFTMILKYRCNLNKFIREMKVGIEKDLERKKEYDREYNKTIWKQAGALFLGQYIAIGKLFLFPLRRPIDYLSQYLPTLPSPESYSLPERGLLLPLRAPQYKFPHKHTINIQALVELIEFIAQEFAKFYQAIMDGKFYNTVLLYKLYQLGSDSLHEDSNPLMNQLESSEEYRDSNTFDQKWNYLL